MSLGLDSKISALPLRHQGPRLPRAEGRPCQFHSPFFCQVLRPLGANRNTRDQKGGMGGLSPPSCPCPWCLVPLMHLPGVRCPRSPSLVPGQVGPGWALHFWGAQRVKGTDTAPLGTSLLGPRVDLVPSVTSPSLPQSRVVPHPCHVPWASPASHLSHWGRDPPTLQRGQGIPLPLVPSPLLDLQSSLAQGGGWVGAA